MTVMDANTYIRQRQALWALRRGIALQGSAGDRGQRAYTPTLEENLFEPLSEEARQEYGQGQGQELRRNMRAVHSSSALACNLFHHWKRQGMPGPVAEACGLPVAHAGSIRFEVLHPIADGLDRSQFPHDPNVDAEIVYGPRQRIRAAAVECKFSEPYSGRGHGGIRPAYLERTGLWEGLPHCRELASRICPDDEEFAHLHAAQLLKHVLGLRHAYGQRFMLAYVWYDVPAEAGRTHEAEIARFAGVVRRDGIDFRSITYQEVLLALARRRRDECPEYVDYLVERYL